MELVFVTVIAVVLGGIARYALPGREAYGILLLPAVAGAATAAVWLGLVWLGWAFDGGWIWVVSLAAGIVASVLVALLLPRRRREADAARFDSLARSGA